VTAAFTLPRRLVAEALGSALLLAVVIGSGIMGERLAGGNVAIALLGNTLATGAGLVVLITVFGPISGAHFNPVVTLVALLRREIAGRDAALYPLVQVAGAVAGVWLAHAMFGEPILQVSTKLRDGGPDALGRGDGDLRPDGDHPRDAAFPAGQHAGSGRALHHRRLLVHRLDIVRQSGGHRGAQPVGHLRRDRAELERPAFILAQIAGALLAGRRLFGWLLKTETPHERCRFSHRHLPQPGLRDLAQHRRHGRGRRLRADGRRISARPAGPASSCWSWLAQAGPDVPRELMREKGTPPRRWACWPTVSDEAAFSTRWSSTRSSSIGRWWSRPRA
jgi:hypothetical protein